MSAAKVFYRFSGAHSLLIGLMPFFIPVILWQQGFRVTQVSLFIALTGLGYLLALYGWQRLYRWGLARGAVRQKRMWRLLIGLSFVAELALITVFSLDLSWLGLLVAALLNGVYNCFYWTSQRVMFSTMTKELANNKVGNQFGNFQILVVVLVKVGILLGAYLQQQSFVLLLGISAILSLFAMVMLFSTRFSVIDRPAPAAPLSLDLGRKLVFLADGVFLFFESYFWLLTLYFISDQHIVDLGLTVVGLTLVLSLVFVMIKQRIDHYASRRVFALAIALYAMSWGLRGLLTGQGADVATYAMVIVIAFCTSFFRLSFNKLFFEQVNSQGLAQQSLQLILIKSYLSQAGMVVFFCLLAAVLYRYGESVNTLSTLYWLMIPVAFVYGLYTFSLSPLNESVGEKL